MTDLPPLPEPGFRDPADAYTAAEMRTYGAACAAAEREAIIALLTNYQVPVGNSRAGEMAADWTLDALREIRVAIRTRGKV